MANEITAPIITINGKNIKSSNPKMKVWRKFLEFFDKSDEEFKNMTLAEYTNSMLELLQLLFDHDEVTAESLEENLSVSELKPTVQNAFTWLQKLFFEGVEEIPKNAEAAAET